MRFHHNVLHDSLDCLWCQWRFVVQHFRHCSQKHHLQWVFRQFNWRIKSIKSALLFSSIVHLFINDQVTRCCFTRAIQITSQLTTEITVASVLLRDDHDGESTDDCRWIVLIVKYCDPSHYTIKSRYVKHS
jgi:hypothetical protein